MPNIRSPPANPLTNTRMVLDSGCVPNSVGDKSIMPAFVKTHNAKRMPVTTAHHHAQSMVCERGTALLCTKGASGRKVQLSLPMLISSEFSSNLVSLRSLLSQGWRVEFLVDSAKLFTPCGTDYIALHIHQGMWTFPEMFPDTPALQTASVAVTRGASKVRFNVPEDVVLDNAQAAATPTVPAPPAAKILPKNYSYLRQRETAPPAPESSPVVLSQDLPDPRTPPKEETTAYRKEVEEPL